MNIDKNTIKKYRVEFEAWLAGEKIQFKSPGGNWVEAPPMWCTDGIYRIKPAEPKKPEIYYINVYTNNSVGALHNSVREAKDLGGLRSRVFKCTEVTKESEE